MKVLRGIGAFALFFVVYTVGGAVTGAIVVYMLANRIFWSPPSEGSMLDISLRICAAAAQGFLGIILATYTLALVMKNYPVRPIGVAFILWIAANCLLHFIFFPKSVEFDDLYGVVQQVVGVLTVWFVFRLPPLTQAQESKS